MDIQHEIGRAKNAVSAGDYSTAQKILKKVLTQDPTNVEAWLALAGVVQNPEHAVKCYQRVLKFDPGNQTASQKLISYQQTPTEPDSKRTTTYHGAQALENRLQQVARPESMQKDPWELSVHNPSTTSAVSGTVSKAQRPEPKKRAVKKTPQKTNTSGRWLEISLIVLLVMCAATVFGLVVLIPKNSAVQGGQSAEGASPTPENVTAVIFENIRASNAESISRYMGTIHSKSPAYKSTESITKEAFSMFDLSYKISGVKVIEQNKNQAVVAFVLTTRKIRGASFRDNRINGEMTLKKENGVWKIYNQKVHDVKYLN